MQWNISEGVAAAESKSRSCYCQFTQGLLRNLTHRPKPSHSPPCLPHTSPEVALIPTTLPSLTAAASGGTNGPGIVSRSWQTGLSYFALYSTESTMLAGQSSSPVLRSSTLHLGVALATHYTLSAITRPAISFAASKNKRANGSNTTTVGLYPSRLTKSFPKAPTF